MIRKGRKLRVLFDFDQVSLENTVYMYYEELKAVLVSPGKLRVNVRERRRLTKYGLVKRIKQGNLGLGYCCTPLGLRMVSAETEARVKVVK